jgi:RHS repeat-associated protein
VAVSRSAGASSRGGAAYLGKDILGNVRSTTDEYGALEDRYEYDAFGKPYKGDLTTGMNLGYTGKPYDAATGLYNYGYRDYRPELARFTTVDPVRDGTNWFAYVNNDPVNWVDPWGLKSNVFNGMNYAITIMTEHDDRYPPVSPGKTESSYNINGLLVPDPSGVLYTYKGAGFVDVSVVPGKDGRPTFKTNPLGTLTNAVGNIGKFGYNVFASVVNGFATVFNGFTKKEVLTKEEYYGSYPKKDKNTGLYNDLPSGLQGWWNSVFGNLKLNNASSGGCKK